MRINGHFLLQNPSHVLTFAFDPVEVEGEERMKITLLAAGRTDIRWVKEGLELYTSRLGHYIHFAVNELPDLKNAASLSREQIREKEGEMFLSAVRSRDSVILLDEHGRQFRSVEFAGWMQGRMSAGRDMVFVAGGPYGFSRKVHERADGAVSLSEMTFSHQMVRVIFAEQLYRAFTIMKGEPYHHE